MVEAAGRTGTDREESLIKSCVGGRVLFVKQNGYYLRPEDKLRPMEIMGETLRRGGKEIFSRWL